jgi:hypothetical protein
LLRCAAVLETGSRLVGRQEPLGPEPATGAALPTKRSARQIPPKRRWSANWLTLGVFLVYCGIALAAYWPILPGDSRFVAGYGGDPEQQVWFLAWTAFAVLHGHNPWLTTYLHYPQGVNLAENTSMPLLGLLGLPVTWAFGPIVTFNLFMWLAYPVSALACFVLLRRWVRWPVAAFVGGLLYGFSPDLAAQGLGHLNLLVVPFPPLVLLLLDDLLVRRRGRPLSRGLLLGVVLAAEFLVSPELFASTILMVLVGLLLLVLARPRQVRDRLGRAWPGLLACGVLTGAVVAYPAWVEFAGPHAFLGPPQQLVFAADLLGTVVPTKLQLLDPAALVRVGARFAGGDPSEADSYLGLPLLLVLAGFVLTHWQRGEVRLAAALFVAATVVSWGSHLEVAGHATGIPLPVDLVSHLPLFQDFVYARFALYADLAAAWLLALAVDQAHSRWRTRRSPVWLQRSPGVAGLRGPCCWPGSGLAWCSSCPPGRTRSTRSPCRPSPPRRRSGRSPGAAWSSPTRTPPTSVPSPCSGRRPPACATGSWGPTP